MGITIDHGTQTISCGDDGPLNIVTSDNQDINITPNSADIEQEDAE